MMPPQNALRMVRTAQPQAQYGQYYLPTQQDNAMLAAPPDPTAHNTLSFDQMGTPDDQAHYGHWLSWLQQLMQSGR